MDQPQWLVGSVMSGTPSDGLGRRDMVAVGTVWYESSKPVTSDPRHLIMTARLTEHNIGVLGLVFNELNRVQISLNDANVWVFARH